MEKNKEGWIVKRINSKADTYKKQGEFLSEKPDFDVDLKEWKWKRSLTKEQAPIIKARFADIKELIEKNKLSVDIHHVEVGIIGNAIRFRDGEPHVNLKKDD